MTDQRKDHIGKRITSEVKDARILIAFFFSMLLSGFVIVSLLISNAEKDNEIRSLSNNRVMYGILSSDGRYFESVKDIPNRIIKNFSTAFIMDWANFTPKTIENNRNSAIEKMSIEYAKERTRKNDRIVKQYKNNKFAQHFVPKTYKATDEGRNKIIEITGMRRQYQNGIAMGLSDNGYEVTYEFTITKTPPTESSPEGLEITKLVEPKITYDNSRKK